MKFLKRHRGWVAIIVGFGVLFGLSYLTGWLLGPVTCRDGWASGSIGTQGACSWHGGVDRSRGGLFFLYLFLGGFSGWWVMEKLEDRPTYRRPDPILHQRCPKCGGHMSYANDDRTKAKCHRYPVCSGEKEMADKPNPRLAFDPNACPQCGMAMRLRTAKRGKHPGSQFWGCSQYPRCRGTRPYKKPEGDGGAA